MTLLDSLDLATERKWNIFRKIYHVNPKFFHDHTNPGIAKILASFVNLLTSSANMSSIMWQWSISSVILISRATIRVEVISSEFSNSGSTDLSAFEVSFSVIFPTCTHGLSSFVGAMYTSTNCLGRSEVVKMSNFRVPSYCLTS